MYELYPYFTNDGTVGLFSRNADDIYHSTTGAVTESWQKFILPSHIKEFIKNNNSVKILDICYGIGYNTKVALKVFCDNYFEKKSEQKNKSNKNFLKNSLHAHTNIAAIYTDNISQEKNKNSCKNIDEQISILEKSYSKTLFCIDEIDTDNSIANFKPEILIDAIDMDKILIQLAPFIVKEKKYNIFSNDKFDKEKLTEHELDKFAQIKKIRNDEKSKLPSEYKINNEIELILLKSLIEDSNKNFGVLNDKDLCQILLDKNYSPFFNKYMINFAKFCQKYGYKSIDDKNKTAFLHNIYYRYLSRSYKKALEIAKNNKIDINFHNIDARTFVRASEQTYDFIFLDAFTPAKCPALWTTQFFEALFHLLDNDGMLLTYSNSAAVRNAMLSNGFYIGKIYNPTSKKFIGTIATKNKNLIEYELSEQEIGLLNSKAGICYDDENLDLDNKIILQNRAEEVKNSDLVSSARYFRSLKK